MKEVYLVLSRRRSMKSLLRVPRNEENVRRDANTARARARNSSEKLNYENGQRFAVVSLENGAERRGRGERADAHVSIKAL